MAAIKSELIATKDDLVISTGDDLVGTTAESKDLVSYFREFSKNALMDTDLLPIEGSGVLAIRKALQHVQFIYQCKPGIYPTWWGKYERDKSAELYQLAMPWRVIIADIIDGQLLGARHFYSPVIVQTWDQVLYHCNVPNINCWGYGAANGVGWICLYHTTDYSKLTLGEQIRAIVQRTSGEEAYNDANMSSTDGTRFYQKMYGLKGLSTEQYKAYNYLWDPKVWEKKSQTEGHDWTLDPDLWIPVRVNGIDDQTRHVDKEHSGKVGVPLTLRMAAYGKYNAYYQDPHQPKPVNTFVRDDIEQTTPQKIFDFMRKAAIASIKSGQVVKAKVPGIKKGGLVLDPVEVPGNVYAHGGHTNITNANWTFDEPGYDDDVDYEWYCGWCDGGMAESPTDTVANGNGVKLHSDEVICMGCYENNHFEKCAHCQKLHAADDGYIIHVSENDTWSCGCVPIYSCMGCNATYENQTKEGVQLLALDYSYCLQCTPNPTACDVCSSIVDLTDTHDVEFLDLGAEYSTNHVLCGLCFESSMICACGYLKPEDVCSPVPHDGGIVQACTSCVEISQEDLTVSYVPVDINLLSLAQ